LEAPLMGRREEEGDGDEARRRSCYRVNGMNEGG